MKGTGAKRNVCPGSCVSTGAKFPVAPVESAPMHTNTSFYRLCALPDAQPTVSKVLKAWRPQSTEKKSLIGHGFAGDSVDSTCSASRPLANGAGAS